MFVDVLVDFGVVVFFEWRMEVVRGWESGKEHLDSKHCDVQ